MWAKINIEIKIDDIDGTQSEAIRYLQHLGVCLEMEAKEHVYRGYLKKVPHINFYWSCILSSKNINKNEPT